MPWKELVLAKVLAGSTQDMAVVCLFYGELTFIILLGYLAFELDGF